MDVRNVALWRQFGAALDMLDDALRVCPDALWKHCVWVTPPGSDFPTDFASFWYLSYHTIKWADLYLFGSDEGFSPPAEFSPVDFDVSANATVNVYTKEMLRRYLHQVREKCQRRFTAMTDEETVQSCSFPWIADDVSYYELQMYSLRHVQEHTAQLHLFLGQHDADGDSDWVSVARPEPHSD